MMDPCFETLEEVSLIADAANNEDVLYDAEPSPLIKRIRELEDEKQALAVENRRLRAKETLATSVSPPK